MDMGNDDFLRGLFDDIDEDGSGVLDRGEIAELARKLLGKPLTKREIDAAMEEMDGDGNGEIDFEEFRDWWHAAKEKNSSLVSAMNERYEKAMKVAQAAARKEKEASEAQRALAAVAKSHGSLMSRINRTDEKNRGLRSVAARLQEQLRDADREVQAERQSRAQDVDGLGVENDKLHAHVAALERDKTLLSTELEALERRRQVEVRSMATAHEENLLRIRRKDLRIEALVAQVGGVDQRVAALRMDMKNERERTAQVQIDLERVTERLTRDKQLEVARREDQITRLLGTLERLREKESVLLEELRATSEKKDAYRMELRDLKKMINGAHRSGRSAKKSADQGTFFTVVR